jgi:hypothetical protein
VEAVCVFAESDMDLFDCMHIAKGDHDKMTLVSFDKTLNMSRQASRDFKSVAACVWLHQAL